MNLLEIRQKNRDQITRSLTALSFMEQAIATLNSFAQKDLRKGDEQYEEIITAQDLDHLLNALTQVRGNVEVIELREYNIEKYREYFLEFQRWEPLLQEINSLLQDLRIAKRQISFSLRFTEYFCLVNSSLAVPESEQSFKDCLYDASYAVEDRITAGLELAQYYINNSKYVDSLQCLNQAYQLIQITLSKKDYFLGYYHLLTAHCAFYQIHLIKAHREFLIAKNYLILALQNEDTKEVNFRMQTCLHYMGRNYNAYFNLNQAINHYVDAQKMFEDIWNKFSLPYRTAATAFYHLRMADALEALKISRSARFHYQESLRLFEKSKSKAIAQTRLSEIKRLSQQDFPELISSHDLFLEKERRYQQEILNVIEMDYKRGEIEGLTWLLQLYIQHLKLKPAWKTIKRLHRFQTVNDQYSFVSFWLLVFSMLCWDVIAPIYIHRFLRFVKPDFLLTECPCDECRSRQF
jgi:tetratricopeptide (TPR) repeat protein